MGSSVTREQLDQALDLHSARISTDLRQEIAAQGDSLRQEIATHADTVRQEMAAQGDTLRQDMVKQNEQLLDKITEVVRDVQTEILKAFFPFQESVSIRFRKLETDNSNLNYSLSQRMEILERRLQEIEKKLLMAPPAF